MATRVRAMLTSSKLEVMQGDLHLVGSSIDQLIVQFDQMAFDEYLAADQIKAGKRRHSITRASASGSITSSQSFGSIPSSDSESISTPARPRTYYPAKGKEIP